MRRIVNKLILFLLITLIFIINPKLTQAQWPAVYLGVYPTYEDGKITYGLELYGRIDGRISNITAKIPLPEGTRFLEATTPPGASIDFDGKEVTFFTPVFHGFSQGANFTVEITDKTKTNFVTRPWMSWEGDLPGDFLFWNVPIDVTTPPLEWKAPAFSRLNLDITAKVEEDTTTYSIYPYNRTSAGRGRMWDLRVNVPLPEGSELISFHAPPSFSADFDGKEMSFFTAELGLREEVEALTFVVNTEQVTAPFLMTHAWARWKNAGSRVARIYQLEEQAQSGRIITQPHSNEYVIADRIGDVPFPSYDVMSIALQDTPSHLKVDFYSAEALKPVGESMNYNLYLDLDCNIETGQGRRRTPVIGAEYRVRYTNIDGQTVIMSWDSEEEEWVSFDTIQTDTSATGRVFSMWIPRDLLNSEAVCWVANAFDGAVTQPSPPLDFMVGRPRLSRYEFGSEIATSEGTTDLSTTRPLDDSLLDTLIPSLNSSPTTSLMPSTSITDLTGKLAVPIDNGHDAYDVYVFSMPDGQEITRIPNARQPNFRFDGERLLLNREGSGVENVYEYNFADGLQVKVSDAPQDSHPFYDPWGNRVVYGNAELNVGQAESIRDATGEQTRRLQKPFIFVQCSLLPPHQERDTRCQDLPGQGMLVPFGQIGEIQGTHPVWTDEDMIAYKGCNTWVGSRSCGIYSVPSNSTRGFSGGFTPTQLTDHTSDTPTDTKGAFIAFMSQQTGDWEAYLMLKNGSGVRNLSNSVQSNDGLPTISPDGQWVAFVSDRSGRWAVWVTPVTGGDAQKLFDLPTTTPWGNNDRTWINERISWGP